MGLFVRTTLIVAAAIAVLFVLVLVLKLLVVAAVVAALGLGIMLLVRGLRRRQLGGKRRVRVTALTARR